MIISVAPFFTENFSHLFLKEKEKLRINFFLGFLLAMTEILFISFNGSKLELNPMGALSALETAVVWACYSVITRKISGFGFNTILTTRRMFFYGILFMLLILPAFEFEIGSTRLANPVDLFNLIYLGFGASALCFVTWKFALGTVLAVAGLFLSEYNGKEKRRDE